MLDVFRDRIDLARYPLDQPFASELNVETIEHPVTPESDEKISNFFKPIHTILLEKYYFDYLIEQGFGQLFKKIGNEFWRIGDMRIIDHGLVNGIGRNIQKFSSELRKIQSGYIYHYAFIMILSLSLFLGWIIYISIEKT